MPGGEPGDHEKPHRAGELGGEHGRPGQPCVELGHLRVRHADALVEHGQVDAFHGAAGRDAHPAARRRERGGILQQLGEQVDQVAYRMRRDTDLEHRRGVDPLVVLGLRGRRLDQLHQGDRCGDPPARFATGEDEQVLLVAAHARGEVVELEQLLQALRVGLDVLELLDERELPVDQRLAAPGQRHEEARDVQPQQRLLGGQPQRLPVYRAERGAHLADLVGAPHGQLLRVYHRVVQRGPHVPRLAGLGHRGDRPGQLAVRHGQRRATQPAQPPAGPYPEQQRRAERQ